MSNKFSHERLHSWLQAHWSAVLAIAVAVFAAWIAVRYAGQPLLEAHGFRQTQTALTAYWMIHEGWQLAYQTPVAGYPWSIPFEFPLFQSLVALVAWLGDFQLDSAGRLVSFCFLLACAWPAFQITRRIDLPSDVAWIFCALLWSSPIYLFWGRTFMPETAAIFFTFAAIPYVLDLRDPYPRWQSALYFSLFGTLGVLQKVTTAATVIMVMACILLIVHLKTSGIRMPSRRQIVCATVAFSAPFIAAVLWTHYTDLVKEQNFLGAALTSKALAKWNFGTLDQRLDSKVLRTIFWNRVMVKNAAGFFGIALLGGALYFGERRIKTIVLLSLILFVLPIFIFTNLHFAHDYYQTSCVLFLIGALAVSSVPWSSTENGRYAIVPAITILIVISNLYYFSTGYAKNVRMPMEIPTTTTLAVGDVIRRYTPKDSGIVIFGADWSSEIAYYSERKSFTVPRWFKKYDVAWNKPETFLGGKELGGMIYCVSADGLKLNQILERPDVKSQPRLFKLDNCYLWLPNVDSIVLPNSSRPLLPMDFLDKAAAGPRKNTVSGPLSVEAWFAVSVIDDVAPDEIFVTPKKPSGARITSGELDG